MINGSIIDLDKCYFELGVHFIDRKRLEGILDELLSIHEKFSSNFCTIHLLSSTCYYWQCRQILHQTRFRSPVAIACYNLIHQLLTLSVRRGDVIHVKKH